MRGRPQSVTVLACVLSAALALLAWVHGYGEVVAYVCLIVLGVVRLEEDRRRRSAECIRTALRRADISVSKAALIMEMDHADLQRGLSGERKLDWWRLEMLPDVFWQELWPLLAETKGVPALFRTFAKVMPFVDAQERSA